MTFVERQLPSICFGKGEIVVKKLTLFNRVSPSEICLKLTNTNYIKFLQDFRKFDSIKVL